MEFNFGHIEIPDLVIMAIAGLAVLLFGYRIKKVAFFIIWFLLGLNLTNYLMPWLTSLSPEVLNTALWQNLLPIAGGLLLALLGFTIEKVCVGGISFALVMMITAQYFGTDIQTLAIGAVVGIIVAGIAVMLMKPAIIITTAIAGSYALTSCILAWFPGINPEIYYFPILIGVAAIGAGFQFVNSKHID